MLLSRAALAAFLVASTFVFPAAAQAGNLAAGIKARLQCERTEKTRMPSYSEEFGKLNDAFYKIEFMPDNYPGQRVNGKLYPHPLYGTYVLGDYIRSHHLARDPAQKAAYQKALAVVAKATLCHMDSLNNGALAAYYEAPYIVAGQPRFYSALTQAQYLPGIYQAGRIAGDANIMAAAELILRSLDLPESKGGVVFTDANGHGIPQEYPGDANHPPQFVLNGWMDTVIWLAEYHRLSGSKQALALMGRFSSALEDSIKKFDDPEIANSLYKLSEISQINLADFVGGELEVESARVVIPGVGTYPMTFSGSFDDKSYKNIFYGPSSALVDGKLHLTNNANGWLWLSLFSSEGNFIELKVRAVRDSLFQIRLLTGDPIMRGGGKTNLTWTDLIPKTQLHAGETKTLRLAISPENVLRATQPTTYFKPMTVDGKTKYVNVYHFLHASQACRIAKLEKKPELREMGVKWLEESKRWKDIALYDDPALDLRRSDAVFDMKGDVFFSCAP